jgi:hypothetical protein
MNNMNKTKIDKDYWFQLQYVKFFRKVFRAQDKEDLDNQNQSNEATANANKLKQHRKNVKHVINLSSYLNSQLVQNNMQLDQIITDANNNGVNSKIIQNFLKQQIFGFKYCYIKLQVNIKMSSSNDRNIGTTQELTTRLKNILISIANDNIQRESKQITESVETAQLFNNIITLGTQSEVYLEATRSITTVIRDKINKLNYMNEFYYPKIPQDFMKIVLPNWSVDLPNLQPSLKVNDHFQLKDCSNRYIFDGILYINNEYIDTSNIDCLDKCLNMKLLELIEQLDR